MLFEKNPSRHSPNMITSTPEMAKTETLGYQTLVQITHNKCIKE